MNRYIIALILVILAFSMGCWSATSSSPPKAQRGPVSAGDLTAFQRQYMASYYASSGGLPGGARSLASVIGSSSNSSSSSVARATVPISSPGNQFNTLLPAANTVPNYPETGETSTFTVTVAASTPNKVYDVTVTTSFPATDIRQSYVEEYYVFDTVAGLQPNTTMTGWPASDGVWTWDDPVVQPNGTGWTWNQNYRKQMVLTFKDGTIRNEYIVSGDNLQLSGTGGVADPHFAPFNVNGSLDLSQAFVPTATSDTSITFSSVVVYETHPATNPNFWFWAGSTAQTIVGIRYYTEQNSGNGGPLWNNSVWNGTKTATSVSFEKTVSHNTTTGGSYASALATINGGSAWDTLTQTVLREQISWPVSGGAVQFSQAGITKNMQTQAINITGQSSFYVTQLNTDYASISNYSNTAVYAPVGVIDAVLAGNSSASLFTGNTVTSGVAGALPLAVQTVSPSLGTLGQVYTGIVTGTLTSTASSTPAPNPNSGLMASGSSYAFGGQQAVGLTQTSSSVNLGKTGWVEAWIYLNALTDTFGIVHYGQKVDFTDEAYSLQGWSNTGQITLCADTANGSYDQVLSSRLLGTGKWYHIVGVWDVNPPNHYIALYINGVLDNTNSSLSNINPNGSQAATENENQVLIGSQLPTSYSSQYGYFGINGKIVGVNIGSLDGNNGKQLVAGYSASTSAAKVAAQVLANYNASKNNTSGW